MLANNMNDLYIDLVSQVLTHGEKIKGTHELRNVNFTLTNVDNCLATCRNISLPYLIAEHSWYFSASRDTKLIGKFASLWNRITDDGFTSNSAYGFILHKKFGFDQIENVIKILNADPDSRRAVVNINTPSADAIWTKDEPCTIALQFLIRNGKLECTAMMRSSDLWYGIPYDVAYFTTLQKFVAHHLGLETGLYHHFSVSLHIYDDAIEKIKLNFKNECVYFDALNAVKYAQMLQQWIYENIESESLKTDLLTLAKTLDIIGG